MNLLESMVADDSEQVIALQNRAAGLRGFLAIHDTTLGPALGGIRLWRYANEDEAIEDVLRLSRAMTLKAALAELPAGGGKTVLVDHPGLRRVEAFEALGCLIESLGGRYFSGPDVGVTGADLDAVGRHTRYVALESAPGLGDISEMTAIGVWHGMRACLDFAGIRRAKVAIQGAGNVGLALGRILRREGMEIVVADIDPERARAAGEELGARVVAPQEILAADVAVLAPCALGGAIDADVARQLRARVVCGSANNVLATPDVADCLAERGIVYAPDYLVNAGGLIRGAEYYLLHRADSAPSLARIYDRMRNVLEMARERAVSTAAVAEELARARLTASKKFPQLTWRHPLC
ncbi:MAG: Glu/Leu/Phe/Val dehydrogenase [Acidobacteriota bacterium]|nr:Glu/Leu/Phe/Val dehydrogenase [Acidobacteriota bacterium]